ncbi:MAG: N-6 DNA methylase [Thermoguttaceae bacterium]|jgi:adenine-specific DNA methylase|nr:N-6 DNA methylase [Thermoguttaceae bacterium]
MADTTGHLALANKLRGGYYTPPALAEWLCRWAIRRPTDRVLEPSSGDGVFLVEACKRLLSLGATRPDAMRGVRGVEIAHEEARKARARLKEVLGAGPNGRVVRSDFFQWMDRTSHAFDCAVGNPPFIRYQSFPEPSRSLAMRMMQRHGLRPNKLTNIWVPFVAGAAGRLVEGGRLAFVVPAELLQVTYASQLRMFLASHFSKIHLFACNHLFFENAEQEVVLLLADGYDPNARKANACLIEMVATDSIDDILATEPNHREPDQYCTLDHSTEKWLKYFLKPKEIGFMRSLKTNTALTCLATHAEVDIGVVTGRNEFFVIDRPTVDSFHLGEYTMPLLGRSSQLRGAAIDRRQWQALADEGQKVFLLRIEAGDDARLTAGAKRYVARGEAAGHQRGYKCSIRSPWYRVPAVWIPDCFFFRQIYDFPRVVVNDAQATSTDTIHRMRCKSDREAVVTNLYTHLAAASAEIEGRSYGGGVLELEPTEAERLLMPRHLQPGMPVAEIDRLVREGRMTDVLLENDRLVLQAAGLSKADCRLLKQIWVRMRDRRRSRRRGR